MKSLRVLGCAILFSVFMMLLIRVYYVMLTIGYDFATSLPYVYLPLVSIPVACLYFYFRKPDDFSLSKKKASMISALMLIVTLLAPYVMTYIGISVTLSNARGIRSDIERVKFVSSYVLNSTIWAGGPDGIEGWYVYLHRCSSNFLQFLMLGVGNCGEMAYAAKTLLDNLGIESRIVHLSGEDHMFVEIKFNGTWMVVDPGYSYNLVTREERASKRLAEMGGLSYVVAETGQGLIELTTYYVTTDKITIRVTEHGEPVINARIIFKHMFHGTEFSLPEFHSGPDGMLTLNLGPSTYNNTGIEPAEPYYRVYVNDRDSNFIVNSTGTGRSFFIEIDLANIP
ncbi:MAG: transglutaminase-like domain-containing protein [Candidatus Bathyarchaeia archaeon]